MAPTVLRYLLLFLAMVLPLQANAVLKIEITD